MLTDFMFDYNMCVNKFIFYLYLCFLMILLVGDNDVIMQCG